MLSVEDKIQNACFQLNHDAYVLQSKTKKRMRQFSPCEKSLVLLACQREGTHFGMAMAVASRTHCNCHNNLPESGLWDMCFDDTARKAHYGEKPSNTGLQPTAQAEPVVSAFPSAAKANR
jgi:hypothetical protein